MNFCMYTCICMCICMSMYMNMYMCAHMREGRAGAGRRAIGGVRASPRSSRRRSTCRSRCLSFACCAAGVPIVVMKVWGRCSVLAWEPSTYCSRRSSAAALVRRCHRCGHGLCSCSCLGRIFTISSMHWPANVGRNWPSLARLRQTVEFANRGQIAESPAICCRVRPAFNFRTSLAG